EMEAVKLVQTAGAFCLHPHAPKQLGIALRIEHNDNFAVVDVLRDQDLGQPGFAHTSRTDHEFVRNAFGLLFDNVTLDFPQSDCVSRRVSFDIGYWSKRVGPML